MDLHGFFGLTLLQDPCACRQLLEGKFLYVHSYWKLGLQSPGVKWVKRIHGVIHFWKKVTAYKYSQSLKVARHKAVCCMTHMTGWNFVWASLMFSSTDARVIWTLPGEWTGSVHDLTKLLNMLVFELGESAKIAKLLALTPYAPLD